MAQRNLTYSIRGIFTDCLYDHHASQYLIAAYQRGYKWNSGEGNDTQGQVDKLLADLWRAYETPRQGGAISDYYLQFLTLKPVRQPTGETVLEVIDGQQRLTTLSLFFAVLRYSLDTKERIAFSFIEHVASSAGATPGKLVYAVRDRFLDEFVYQGNVHKLVTASSWDAFLKTATTAIDYDQQDIYYLYKAARKIYAFFTEEQRRAKLAAFGAFVADYGRLIANIIAEEVTSEDVFSDLNSNRVPLTDIELVKGLLLTRASRTDSSSFQQVQELRSAQGRQWDEIARWLQQPGVRVLYGLNKESALWQLLRLVALRMAAPFPTVQAMVPPRSAVGNGFPLYEFFESLLSFGVQAPSAADCFQQLQLLSGLLHDWYDTPTIHNQLGVLQASKTYAKKKEVLECITAEEQLLAGGPRAFLRQEISTFSCLEDDLATLAYDAGADKAFDLLLLLNVFPEKASNKHTSQVMDNYPFDFARFNAESWSLEHIYPQHPTWEGEQVPAEVQASLRAIADMNDTQPQILEDGLSPEQAKELRQYVHADNQLLHSLGNLALLTSGDNSSVSNAPFHEKRQRLMQRVRRGSFIAPHTFSVFSKLILPQSLSQFGWTKADIREHATYLEQQRARLAKDFSILSSLPTA
jgi:hypothetical protein